MESWRSSESPEVLRRAGWTDRMPCSERCRHFGSVPEVRLPVADGSYGCRKTSAMKQQFADGPPHWRRKARHWLAYGVNSSVQRWL